MTPFQSLIIGVVRILVGVRVNDVDSQSAVRQHIYFANHSSHLDIFALWSSLPPAIRAKTRAVAARDFWGKGLRRGIGDLFHFIYIDRRSRRSRAPDNDPLQPLAEALEQGDSLIIFPEGTRDQKPGAELAFKSGLYHLAQRYPEIELNAVYLDRFGRSLPKGRWLPLPIECNVRFGAPMQLRAGESKHEFLERAQDAVKALA